MSNLLFISQRSAELQRASGVEPSEQSQLSVDLSSQMSVAFILNEPRAHKARWSTCWYGDQKKAQEQRYHNGEQIPSGSDLRVVGQ